MELGSHGLYYLFLKLAINVKYSDIAYYLLIESESKSLTATETKLLEFCFDVNPKIKVEF